jgi:hypothetical protein
MKFTHEIESGRGTGFLSGKEGSSERPQSLIWYFVLMPERVRQEKERSDYGN